MAENKFLALLTLLSSRNQNRGRSLDVFFQLPQLTEPASVMNANRTGNSPSVVRSAKAL